MNNLNNPAQCEAIDTMVNCVAIGSPSVDRQRGVHFDNVDDAPRQRIEIHGIDWAKMEDGFSLSVWIRPNVRACAALMSILAS